MVTVYSQFGCQPCKATIRSLTNLSVPHRVIDIQEDTEARNYVTSLGYQQTPVVVAGDQHWSGFNPGRIKALA